MPDDQGDGLVHRYHAGCNLDLALCGADLTGEEDYDEAAGDDPLCIVCAELVEVDDCAVTCRLVVFT